eukprot:7264285-Heterocapsa_arctica.AAC.1
MAGVPLAPCRRSLGCGQLLTQRKGEDIQEVIASHLESHVASYLESHARRERDRERGSDSIVP